MKVLFYILSTLKYRQAKVRIDEEDIVAKTGVSRSSVFSALKDMQKYDFCRKIQNGFWMMNPAFISDVDELLRKRLLQEYYGLENEVKE